MENKPVKTAITELDKVLYIVRHRYSSVVTYIIGTFLGVAFLLMSSERLW